MGDKGDRRERYPAASLSKADDVGDADAEQGGEQDGNDKQDGDEAHEG